MLDAIRQMPRYEVVAVALIYLANSVSALWGTKYKGL